MKKTVLLFYCSIVLLFLSFKPVWAVESTPSAVSEDEVKDKIKERLENVVEKGLEKVKGILTQEKENQIYAWVGTIDSVSDSSFKIETLSGLKEAEIASTAAIFKVATGKAKKEIEAEDIEKGQFTLTMGPKRENEVILGKRIIVMDEAPISPAKREIVAGKVTEVDESKVTIQKNSDTLELTLGKKIPLKINGIKSPTVEDIQVNDYLTAIVSLDKNDQPDEVKAVLVVRGKTNPQAEENEATEEEIEAATPAATEDQEE